MCTASGTLPDYGATLIEATFPRTYIDPNRAEGDLDPAMIDGEWPVPLQPGPRRCRAWA
jgi:N-formylglutamate deformylase